MIIRSLVCVCFLLVGSESVHLFVRLSAGLPKDQGPSNRMREVTFHLHDLNETIVRSATLTLASDADFATKLKSWDLESSLTDKTEDFSGRVFSGFKFNQTNFREHPAEDTCLGFYVRLTMRGEVLAENCLKVHPDWMGQLMLAQPSFGQLPLTSLALPGTHNAGAFKVFEMTDGVDELYRDCQEEDTYTQLIYGSRYLDLRPGINYINHVKGSAEFWIFHWLLQTNNRLRDVLLDVRRFLDEHPGEVVFVDFHEFPYLFDRYAELGELVESCLGKYIFRGAGPRTKLSEVLKTNQRAVVSFAEDGELSKKYLPGVQHIWADTDVLPDLKNFVERLQLDKHYSGRRFLYSAMAELTPTGWGIAWNRYEGGVRALAHRNNLQISSWWVTDPTYRDAANIVSVDYLMSTDIVEACISMNTERAAISVMRLIPRKLRESNFSKANA